MTKALATVGVSIMILGALSTARAVEPQHFQVRTTADLLELCSAEGVGVPAAEALNFCYGYAVGAVQYHLATTEPGDPDRLLCLPEPKPSRASVVQEFIAWGTANPGHAADSALDGLFLFLEQRFHCP